MRGCNVAIRVETCEDVHGVYVIPSMTDSAVMVFA